MADARFSEFWHSNQDILVTVRARLHGSMSGWHDFVYAEPFKGEGGFSIPDALVHDIVPAPELPGPIFRVGDLVTAEFIDECGNWKNADYFELIDPHHNVWRSMRDTRRVSRTEMRNITPIAREGRPWTDDDS